MCLLGVFSPISVFCTRENLVMPSSIICISVLLSSYSFFLFVLIFFFFFEGLVLVVACFLGFFFSVVTI